MIPELDSRSGKVVSYGGKSPFPAREPSSVEENDARVHTKRVEALISSTVYISTIQAGLAKNLGSTVQ